MEKLICPVCNIEHTLYQLGTDYSIVEHTQKNCPFDRARFISQRDFDLAMKNLIALAHEAKRP